MFLSFDVKDKVATIVPAADVQLQRGLGGLIEEDPSAWTFTLTQRDHRG